MQLPMSPHQTPMRNAAPHESSSHSVSLYNQQASEVSQTVAKQAQEIQYQKHRLSVGGGWVLGIAVIKSNSIALTADGTGLDVRI